MNLEQSIDIIIKCLHFFNVTLCNNLEWRRAYFPPAAFSKPPSAFLVARQPLRSGVEHKFKGAAQLPDQLMTNVKVPVMSTIDYAFLLSPDLTLQTPLQERDQRHTCTKPSPPLSIFSLSFPASFPSFHEVDFVPSAVPQLHWWTHTHSHLLVFAPCSPPHPCPPSLSSLLIIALITGAWNQPHLLIPREKLMNKRFIFHLLLVLSFCLNSVFDSLVVTVKLRLDR